MRGDPWRGPWPLRARRVPRRATDWVEAAAACVLVGVGLAATAVALVMGLRVCADGLKQAQAESARTRITAVLLDDVTVAVEGREDGPATLVSVLVHWKGRGGVEHTGVAQVHGPLRAGDRVTVWVDPDGHVVGSPVTADDVVLIAIVSVGLFPGEQGAIFGTLSSAQTLARMVSYSAANVLFAGLGASAPFWAA
ncbi:MAG: hypothetical protein QOG76_6705, partial [Pseudonocardiales bacterium]|nr:hypothetical protein [Pseudonocardiales bacterium]